MWPIPICPKWTGVLLGAGALVFIAGMMPVRAGDPVPSGVTVERTTQVAAGLRREPKARVAAPVVGAPTAERPKALLSQMRSRTTVVTSPDSVIAAVDVAAPPVLSGAGVVSEVFPDETPIDEVGGDPAVTVEPTVDVSPDYQDVSMGTIQTGSLYGNISWEVHANGQELAFRAIVSPLYKDGDPTNPAVAPIMPNQAYGVRIEADYGNWVEDHFLAYVDAVTIDGFPCLMTEAVVYASGDGGTWSYPVRATVKWDQPDPEKPPGEYSGRACLSASYAGDSDAAQEFQGLGADRYNNDTGIARCFVTVRPPAAPSNLTATTQGPTSVLLAWQCNSCNAETFEIERRAGDDPNWQQRGSVPANTTNSVDAIGVPGRTYQYRVRAVNAAGASPYSSMASAFVGGGGLVLANHGLIPLAPAVRSGETFVARFQVTNSGSQSVPVDLRLGYRNQGGATGVLVGQGNAVIAPPGTTWHSISIVIPPGMASGYYDLDWRIYSHGTQELLASSGGYDPLAFQLLPGATGPSLTLGPSTVDFGTVPVGAMSQNAEIVVSNSGTTPLDVTAVRLGGAIAPECTSEMGLFCLNQFNTPFTIEPSGSRHLLLVFRPQADGYRSAILTLDTNDPNGGSRSVLLRGTGVMPGSGQLSILDVRPVRLPEGTYPPVANQDALVYVDIQNTGTVQVVGNLIAALSVWDMPGVGHDGFWVGHDHLEGRRQYVKFLADQNPTLTVGLMPGESTTLTLAIPNTDETIDPPRLRFLSSHFSDLLEVVISHGTLLVPAREELEVAANPDEAVNCLSEIVSMGMLGQNLECLAGVWTAAYGMGRAAEYRDMGGMGQGLWDMGCAVVDCGTGLLPWVIIFNFCRTVIDTWQNESVGNGCGGVVLDVGYALAQGMRDAALRQGHLIGRDGQGGGAYLVLGNAPAEVKVRGEEITGGHRKTAEKARGDSIQVTEIGGARLVYVPTSLLGPIELAGFSELTTQFSVGLLSPVGSMTIASYPDLSTGPGTVLHVNLADAENPFVVAVDDDGNGTVDWSVVPSETSTVDAMPPSPVRNPTGWAGGTVVSLGWRNPDDGDFDSLLVKASEEQFPRTPTMGRLVLGSAGLVPGDSLSFSEDVTDNGTYYYSFFAVDTLGNVSAPETLRVIVDASNSVEGPPGSLDRSTRIRRVVPNPSRSSASIYYSLGASGPVAIEVFDLQGRRVAVAEDEARAAAGVHVAEWDGTDLRGQRAASGTYLVRLTSAGGIDSRRIVLLK